MNARTPPSDFTPIKQGREQTTETGAHPASRDRAGGPDGLEPAAQSQPEALIPCAVKHIPNGRCLVDHSNPAGLTFGERYRACVDASGDHVGLECWEAILPYANSDDYARNEFFMPRGSTEGQARYHIWQTWSLARCGSNVQPSLILRRVDDATLSKLYAMGVLPVKGYER